MRIRAKYQQSSLDLIVFCFFPVPFLFYIFLFVFFFAITTKDCFVKCVNKNVRLPLCMCTSASFFFCFCYCRIDGHMNDDPIFHFVLVVFFSPFRFAHTKQNQRNRNIKMPCDFCIWMIFVWSVFLCDFLTFLTS